MQTSTRAPARTSPRGRSRRLGACMVSGAALWLGFGSAAAHAQGIVYVSEGNNLRRLELASSAGALPRAEVFIEHAAREDGADAPSSLQDPRRRDVNGMICPLPDGSGRFVAGEDTGQPETPPGWGVFTAEGRQIGKLTTTYRVELGDPHGCAFDAEGRLFTTDVGNVGFGPPRGQLVLWFPPFDHFPGPPGAYPATTAQSAAGSHCKLAGDIGNALGVAIDRAGRVYVASAGRGTIERFSPPFPTGATAERGCGRVDASGAPLASQVTREVFHRGLYTFSGLAFAANGNLYAASVFTGEIIELDPGGARLRSLLDPSGFWPPSAGGSPMGLAIDAEGSLYYADLDLVWRFPSISPGPNGKVRRIRFDAAGQPGAPETLIEGLRFPDGLTVLPDRLEAAVR